MLNIKRLLACVTSCNHNQIDNQSQSPNTTTNTNAINLIGLECICCQRACMRTRPAKPSSHLRTANKTRARTRARSLSTKMLYLANAVYANICIVLRTRRQRWRRWRAPLAFTIARAHHTMLSGLLTRAAAISLYSYNYTESPAAQTGSLQNRRSPIAIMTLYCAAARTQLARSRKTDATFLVLWTRTRAHACHICHKQ